MRPINAFSAVLVIALLLVLTPLTIFLHTGSVDRGMTWTFVLIAIAIILLALWMLRRSDVVAVVKPYGRLGFGTFVFVLGVLLILGAITAWLLGYPISEPLMVDIGDLQQPLPGLHKLLPASGVALMLLGMWINQSDKYYLRLPS